MYKKVNSVAVSIKFDKKFYFFWNTNNTNGEVALRKRFRGYRSQFFFITNKISFRVSFYIQIRIQTELFVIYRICFGTNSSSLFAAAWFTSLAPNWKLFSMEWKHFALYQLNSGYFQRQMVSIIRNHLNLNLVIYFNKTLRV